MAVVVTSNGAEAETLLAELKAAEAETASLRISWRRSWPRRFCDDARYIAPCRLLPAYGKAGPILGGDPAMHALIEQHREAIADICRRFGVRRLEVFGSAARAIDFHPDTSDADFLVEFAPDNGLPFLHRFFGLQDALSHLLSRSIDLVEPSAVRNPYVRASIDRSREVVYGAWRSKLFVGHEGSSGRYRRVHCVHECQRVRGQ